MLDVAVAVVARGRGVWCQTKQDGFVVIVVVVTVAAIAALGVVFREEFPHVEGRIVLADNG